MQDEVGRGGKMGFGGYQQLSLQFDKTDDIGHISHIQDRLWHHTALVAQPSL